MSTKQLKFKPVSGPIHTSDPYYDLTIGGYIEPEKLLEEEDAKRVSEAVRLVQAFLDQAEARGIIEVL